MGVPVCTTAVAFESDPLDASQSYDDISEFLKEFRWQYGRQRERDTAGQGTSTLTLVDDEGVFDPDHAAGVFYPDVLGGRRVRCQAVLGIHAYDVFQTFVDPEQGWRQAWENPGFAAVTLTAYDAFDVLENALPAVGTTLPEQTTGARVAAILDLVDWPAALRDIDPGLSMIQAVDAGDASALSLLRQAEITERGFLFVAPDGKVTFHDRSYRLHSTSVATFCDADNIDAGRISFKRIVPASARIINDWRVTRTGGVLQTAEDAASITTHGRRTEPLTVWQTSDGEAMDVAEWELLHTKDRRRRFDEMTLVPGDDTATWVQILARRPGDRIRVIATPPGQSSPVTVDVHIEGMALDWGPGVQAEARWRLSPVDDARYIVLNDPVYSEIDSTNRLGL